MEGRKPKTLVQRSADYALRVWGRLDPELAIAWRSGYRARVVDEQRRYAETRAALAAMVADYRTEGCAIPDCRVCERSRTALQKAHAALYGPRHIPGGHDL